MCGAFYMLSVNGFYQPLNLQHLEIRTYLESTHINYITKPPDVQKNMFVHKLAHKDKPSNNLHC